MRNDLELQPVDERAALIDKLEFVRNEAVARLSDLVDDQASARPLARTQMSAGGVLKHLAYVEDRWFVARFQGEPLPEPWLSAPIGVSAADSAEPDWPFTSSDSDSVETLLGLYSTACERSRAVVGACTSLDTLASSPSFGKAPVSLRWLLVHMVSETSWHLGHLDLIRDALGVAPATG